MADTSEMTAQLAQALNTLRKECDVLQELLKEQLGPTQLFVKAYPIYRRIALAWKDAEQLAYHIGKVEEPQ